MRLRARVVLLCTAIAILSSFLLFDFRHLVLAGSEPLAAFKGVLTYHNDNLRTGRNSSETTLTFKNLNSTMFGKLFVISTDGRVDAEPLYAPNISIPGNGTHNVLFAASEHGTVYGFDADNGSTLWQVTTLKSGETSSDNRGCGQVTPEIGVTSTPVIDLTAGTHGTIYVVAMSKDSSSNYHQRLHALDITTGAEQFGGPVDIAAQYPARRQQPGRLCDLRPETVQGARRVVAG